MSILRGIPGTGGVKDPATRRVLDAVVDNLRRMAPQPVASGTPTSAIPAVTRTVVTRETQTVGEFKLLNTGGGVPIGSKPQPDTLALRTLTVGELVEIVAQAGGTIQIGLGTPPGKVVTSEDLPLMYRPSTGEYFIEVEPENLLLAIKERQIAWGITTAWDSGDPANPAKLIDDSEATEYTIEQLRAYVNYIAQGDKYIDPTDNAWDGGETLPGTLDNATWVDGTNAADEAALMVKVKSLLYTVYSLPAETFVDPKMAYGQAGITEPLATRFAEAYAAALAATTNGNFMTFAGAYIQLSANKTDSLCQVYMEWKAWTYVISGLATALSKSVRIYNKLVSFAGGYYGDYNGAFIEGALADGEYAPTHVLELGTDAGATTEPFGGIAAPAWDDLPPPEVPSMPESGQNINYANCYLEVDGRFAMVEWAFTAR